MLKIAVFIVTAIVLIGLLSVSQQKSGPLVVPGFVETDGGITKGVRNRLQQ